MNSENWTRKELKDRAKVSFKQNYWKCVAVALIIAVFSGAFGGAAGSRAGSELRRNNTSIDQSYDIDVDGDEYWDSDDEDWESDIDADVEDILGDEALGDEIADNGSGLVGAFLAVFLIILLVIFSISFLISIFLGNPLLVGAWNFFYKNDKEKADFNCVGRGFNTNYLNVVKISFFMDLKIIGWSLLLIVPGIVKSYEYRMIPFILAENPDISSKEAFEISRNMMTGQKWNSFVLDLSFILWNILSGLTLGIVGVFYVFPYMYQTQANLYAVLKGDYINGEPEREAKNKSDVVVEF